MKIFYTILLLIFLFSENCFSQETSTSFFQVSQIPSEGVLLDKDWKFQVGDNPEWRQYNYDDLNWSSFDINKPASQFLANTKGNIAWLRLHFTFDSARQDIPLSLLINQYGASEVYIDGQLVQRFGSISSKEIISFNPHNNPIPLQLNQQPDHVLAIRFACPMPLSSWLLNKATVVPLLIRLQPTSAAIDNLQTQVRRSRISVGVMSIYTTFGLLFLLIFLFFRRQPLNLFFSLTNISIAVQHYVLLFSNEGQYGLKGYIFLQLLLDFSGRVIGSSVLVFMLFALFERVHPFFKWFVIYILTIDFVLASFFPVQYVFVQPLSHIVFTLIFLGLTIYTFRNYNLKNWFIGIMALNSFLANLTYFLSFFWEAAPSFYWNIFPFFTLPSMIIYLSLRYAQVNTSLEEQLIQVKNLSEENLRNEQEKQLLLASQNEMLEKTVDERTAELTHSLEELKSTQAQLIQSEKMASLGELTAGIAHEIQNPLNFVNNFSDVNKELLAEMNEEMEKENYHEAKVIAKDVIDNEEKINHHGKRADAIVKGMLQHSQTSTGQKEPTDINKLANEYLRLSYQGFRAKDKLFNATLQTDFDESIGKINIIPQDIGRVLLNLYNNAFYAVSQKHTSTGSVLKESKEYEPIVSVNTRKIGDNVEIKVADNGNGIPQKIVDKIFQPFFTTKPTGQGTGLGLSLAYDIIKAHGGELKVELKEGEGAEFVILLPLKEHV